MKILAIDFGLKNMGLAIAYDDLIEPFGQIKFENFQEAQEKILKILKEEEVEKIVIGISEGKMAKLSKEFAKRLQEKISLPIILQDESFTSLQARDEMLKIAKPRKKRQKQEHQIAACLLLENFIARIKAKGGFRV